MFDTDRLARIGAAAPPGEISRRTFMLQESVWIRPSLSPAQSVFSVPHNTVGHFSLVLISRNNSLQLRTRLQHEEILPIFCDWAWEGGLCESFVGFISTRQDCFVRWKIERSEPNWTKESQGPNQKSGVTLVNGSLRQLILQKYCTAQPKPKHVGAPDFQPQYIVHFNTSEKQKLYQMLRGSECVKPAELNCEDHLLSREKNMFNQDRRKSLDLIREESERWLQLTRPLCNFKSLKSWRWY